MIDASRLAQLRVSRGLSQRKVAHLTGVNYQVIRRIEAGGDDGNLTLRHLGRLAESLGVAPADLLAGQSASPAHGDSDPAVSELTIAQARLLRRIHRGEDVRRILTNEERDLVLPSLVHRGLVSVSGGGPYRLTDSATADLTP